MRIQPLILAAGKGTRMLSKKPKVLQEIGGTTMLEHVLTSCSQLQSAQKPLVVVGFEADQIKQRYADRVNFVDQAEQLGTGHAVMVAAPYIDDHDLVIILYGDVPLIRAATLRRVVDHARSGALSLLTVNMDDASGYGRILRAKSGAVTAIVEQKDASAEQQLINEVNTGIMALRADKLKSMVAELSNDNAQSEYYLTDIIAMAVAKSIDIQVSQPDSADEVLGANDRHQLANLEALFKRQKADQLMAAGARLIDPERIDIRGNLSVGQDVTIDANVVFQGRVTLGDDVVIEPNCVLIDADIESGARIRAFSHIEGAHVGRAAVIGPYARLRQGSVIGAQAKVGNFVETKNTQLGQGSKANHLSYLGDTHIGEGVNIGAGTITCNYDGKHKHKTEIADDVFVGSNSALIAPVVIGKGATIAAGAVVTKNVAEQELSIARQPQKQVKNWFRPDQK